MSRLLTPPEVVQALINGKNVEIKRLNDSQNSEWEPLNEHEIHIRVLTIGLFMFRLAEEMITIGDVSFPKPVSEPLKEGQEYFMPDLCLSGLFHRGTWDDDYADTRRLNLNGIHLSKENAIAHAKALIKLSGGTVDD